MTITINYDLLEYLAYSLIAVSFVWLIVSLLASKRSERKRREMMALPDYDINNPINCARMTRPGVGEVDENGFTRLW